MKRNDEEYDERVCILMADGKSEGAARIRLDKDIEEAEEEGTKDVQA